MSFKVLYTTATHQEAEALRRVAGLVPIPGGFMINSIDIALLITGIGSVPTVYNIMKWVSENGKPDLAINAGIAGSFNPRHGIGQVLMPVEDCFADLGIEDGDAHHTIFESNLVRPDEFPFNNGIIVAENNYAGRLKQLLEPVKAVTCNTVTGSVSSKDRLIRKFKPDIETMEGASFFYICTQERIPFFAVRAVSNFIETRNRDNWNITLALEKLTGKLEEIFNNLI